MTAGLKEEVTGSSMDKLKVNLMASWMVYMKALSMDGQWEILM